MKVKVLLDHVSREIDFAISLKKTIESNGLGSVSICHQDFIVTEKKYDFFERVFDGKYDIIIIPSYHVKRTPEMLMRALFNRAKIIVYHSEQIIREYIEPEKLNLDYLKQFNKHIAAHFVWGDNFSSKLIDKAGIEPNKIFQVGNYKLDFVVESCLAIRKSVLIASDYKPGDMSLKDMNDFYEQYGIKYDEARALTCKKSRFEMLKFVEELAIEYPGVNFTLRPHPGEDTSLYLSLTSYRNIELSKLGSTFSSDLNNCDLVLGFTSTSCLEVVASKKRFVSIDFIDFDKNDLSQHKIMLDWRTKEDTRNIIKKLEQGILPPENIEQQNVLGSLVTPYNNVGNNILIALEEIKNGYYKTEYTASDVIPIAKCFLLGIAKLILIKSAVKLNGKFMTHTILKRALSSISTRREHNEYFDDETMMEYYELFNSYVIDRRTYMKNTDLGFKFYEN